VARILRRYVAIGVAVFLCSTLSNAQQGLVGTYEGRWIFASGSRDYYNYGTLKIASAENGKLVGTFTIAQQACKGEYLIGGTFHDNKLEMQTGDGVLADCGKQPLVLVVQGNKLVGKYSTFETELTKK